MSKQYYWLDDSEVFHGKDTCESVRLKDGDFRIFINSGNLRQARGKAIWRKLGGSMLTGAIWGWAYQRRPCKRRGCLKEEQENG